MPAILVQVSNEQMIKIRREVSRRQTAELAKPPQDREALKAAYRSLARKHGPASQKYADAVARLKSQSRSPGKGISVSGLAAEAVRKFADSLP